MSTPEKPRPSLDDTLAHIDHTLAENHAELGRIARVAFSHQPGTNGPPYTHVHTLPSTEDELAAAPTTTGYTVAEDRTYVAYDEPVRGGWLARALHRLFS